MRRVPHVGSVIVTLLGCGSSWPRQCSGTCTQNKENRQADNELWTSCSMSYH